MGGQIDRLRDGYRFNLPRGEVGVTTFNMGVDRIGDGYAVVHENITVYAGQTRIALRKNGDKFFECYECVEAGRRPDLMVKSIDAAIAWCAGDLE